MRAIRFCMVTTFYPPSSFGGDGVYVERLAHALADRGHHVTVEGVHNLLEAFRRRDEELLVAGDGSLLPSLRKAAADLPNVHFMGWVGPAELATLYRGALSVILPTLGHESFPLVPLEAMSRGTPGILHRFGALAEIAEQSGGALTYRSGDELDAAIDRVASDPSLRRTLGERGRAAYLKHWTEDIHLSAYFGLIEDAARRRGDLGLAAAAEQAGASSPQEAG